MSVKTQLLTVLCLACSLCTLQAQSTVEVSEPALSLKNNKIQIDYDLLNSSESDLFTIRIEVSTESGKIIEPQTLSGDIGKYVSGGKNKQILWDIEADSLFLDEKIYVQIAALPEAPPVALLPPPAEEQEQKPEQLPENEAKSNTSDNPVVKSELKTFNRTSLILQSVVFPGLGLSRLNPGRPYWIMGVAGYGCITGSVIFNRKAYSSYQAYLEPESPRQANQLFNQATSQQSTSYILAYTAIGIWVADLVWTILGTSDLNRQQVENQRGISIGTSVEPVSNILLLAFRYRF